MFRQFGILIALVSPDIALQEIKFRDLMTDKIIPSQVDHIVYNKRSAPRVLR